jgi:hypothetical protein
MKGRTISHFLYNYHSRSDGIDCILMCLITGCVLAFATIFTLNFPASATPQIWYCDDSSPTRTNHNFRTSIHYHTQKEKSRKRHIAT